MARRRGADVRERRRPGARAGATRNSSRTRSGCTSASTPTRSTRKCRPTASASSTTFQTPKAATYQIWNRIGFEFARSPFEWRIDGGPWKRVAPDELTTDLMEIAFWCEVAWLQLGEQPLTAGDAHAGDSASPRRRDKGKTQRILYACDAICLSEGPFHPNSKFKPGRDGRDDATDEAAARMSSSCPRPRPPASAPSVSLEGRLGNLPATTSNCPARSPSRSRTLPAERRSGKAIDVPSDKNKRGRTCSSPIGSGIARGSTCPARAGRPVVLPRLPPEQPEHDRLRQRRLLRLREEPVLPVPDRRDQGHQAGTDERGLGRHPRRLVRPHGRPEPAAEAPQDVQLLRSKFFQRRLPGPGLPDLELRRSRAFSARRRFVAAGGVYASDVFVKPLGGQEAARGRGHADATPPAKDASGEIRWEAVDDTTGQVEKRLRRQRRSRVAAGKTQTVTLTDAWENPKLWWPDTPQPVPAPHHGRRRRQAGRRERDAVRLSRVEDRRHASSRSTASSGTCGRT